MTRYIGDASREFPHVAVAYIETTFPDGARVSGSGALVGRNDVLTAAHLIHAPAHGGEAERVRIELGRDGASRPAGSLEGVQFDYLPQTQQTEGFFTPEESERDLALIGLAQPPGDRLGWFELGDFASGESHRVSGYPSAYREAEGPRMVEDSGKTQLLAPHDVLSLEDFQVSAGSSGGPLWHDAEGTPTLVGAVSTEGWAATVEAHYATLQGWIDGNDALLPVARPTTLEHFLEDLEAEGWHWPEALSDELQQQPLVEYPALERVINPVMRLYIGLLDRRPDPLGAEYWIRQSNEGRPLADLAEGFVDSAEFAAPMAGPGDGTTGVVTTLYQRVLGRAPDPEGQAYWQDALTDGRVDIAELAVALSESDEHVAASHTLVQASKLLLWGVNLEALEAERLGFDTGGFAEARGEAESLVRLYGGALGREPDLEGLAFWLRQVRDGASLADVADQFVASDEYLVFQEGQSVAARIDTLYRQVLGREPDTEGADYWQARLRDDGFDVGDLTLAFTESREYREATEARVDAILEQHGKDGLIGVPRGVDDYLLG